MNWYIKVLKDYANFSGRARRKEYWMIGLINGIVCGIIFALALISGSAIINIILILYVLAIVIPCMALTARRLHDTEHSGWFYFVSFIPLVGPIILLIYLCKAGSTGANRYGADPKAEQPASIIQ